MRIIACQHDYIMTDVEIIEVESTEIRFENDRYHQFWHFDSEEEAEKAFTEVWKEMNSSAITGSDCFLDEALIKAQVWASINRDHDGEIHVEKIKKAGKHAR